MCRLVAGDTAGSSAASTWSLSGLGDRLLGILADRLGRQQPGRAAALVGARSGRTSLHGGAGGSRPRPYRARAADAHDLPALALQDLGDSTVEKVAIGGRHLQAEGVEMRRDNAPADLHGRGTGKIGEQSAGAISHGPGGSQDADTPKARPAARSLPTAPEPRLSAAVNGRSGSVCEANVPQAKQPCCSGRYNSWGILLGCGPAFRSLHQRRSRAVYPHHGRAGRQRADAAGGPPNYPSAALMILSAFRWYKGAHVAGAGGRPSCPSLNSITA